MTAHILLEDAIKSCRVEWLEQCVPIDWATQTHALLETTLGSEVEEYTPSAAKQKMLQWCINQGYNPLNDPALTNFFLLSLPPKSLEALLAYRQQLPTGNNATTFAHIAANGLPVLKALKTASAEEINTQDPEGNTALHVLWNSAYMTLVENDFIQACHLLIENGADVTIRNNRGETPLEILDNYIAYQDKSSSFHFEKKILEDLRCLAQNLRANYEKSLLTAELEPTVAPSSRRKL